MFDKNPRGMGILHCALQYPTAVVNPVVSRRAHSVAPQRQTLVQRTGTIGPSVAALTFLPAWAL